MSNEMLKIKYPKRSSYLKNIILYIRTVMGTKKSNTENESCVYHVAWTPRRLVWNLGKSKRLTSK